MIYIFALFSLVLLVLALIVITAAVKKWAISPLTEAIVIIFVGIAFVTESVIILYIFLTGNAP